MARIYVALAESLLVVTGDPGEVQISERLRNYNLTCVHTMGARPDCVLVGTFDDGLHRSTDGGDTFERVGADAIESASVMSLAVTPRTRTWCGPGRNRAPSTDRLTVG